MSDSIEDAGTQGRFIAHVAAYACTRTLQQSHEQEGFERPPSSQNNICYIVSMSMLTAIGPPKLIRSD